MKSLDGIAASHHRLEATSLYTAAQVLEGQSSVAKSLDKLAANYHRLEITGANTAAQLRRDIIDSLQQLQTKDDREDHVSMPMSLKALAWQLTALSHEAKALSKDLRVIKSLSFPVICERRARIQEAHPNTFDWLFKDKRSKDAVDGTKCLIPMLEWLQTRNGVFWISGKAGSGKSTLMKFLHSHEQTLTALRSWAGDKDLVTASFFFWSLGTDMQKSQQGLLQTLLFHVLRQCPSLVRIVCPAYWHDDDLEEMVWTRTEMIKILLELRKHTIDSARFCFFIDGLDEYEGLHSDVIELVNSFATANDVKIVISSRPWDVFEDAYGDNSGQKLNLQDLTRNDITRFVKDNLEEDEHFRELKASDERYEDLVNEM